MTNELDQLMQDFIDHIKCGRMEEAARTLAERDELLLSELVYTERYRTHVRSRAVSRLAVAETT